MSHRREQIETPFEQRHVQVTMASVIAITLVWLLVCSWTDGRADPNAGRRLHSDRMDGEATSQIPSILIDLNTAEPRELSLLPGVGPVLAKRIALDRVQNGPFAVVDDLRRVRGIGPKTLAEIRHYCIAESNLTSPGRQSPPVKEVELGDPDL